MSETNKFNYKVILSYRGTNYSGWQFQTVNPKTVQNHVQKVIASIANYENYQVIGASRTDTGVHAKGQVLKVTLPKDVEPDKLTLGMNSKLPDDIRVLSSEYVDPKFNVNRDTLGKEYHYYFVNSEVQNVALTESVYYHPKPLDIELMKKACKLLEGEHDFTGFCVLGSQKPNPVRTVIHCSIDQTSFTPFENEIFFLRIKGNGFLKYMVRIIMGALLDIGNQKLSLEEFQNILKNLNNSRIKKRAPANGLHLIEITY